MVINMEQKQAVSGFYDRLQALVDISKESGRFERKIPLRNGQSFFIKNQLLLRGFSPVFSQRKITSIYYDTDDLLFARQNINGENLRIKPRIRFYDDKTNSTVLELKFKKNYIGYKKIYSFKKTNNFKMINTDFINNFSDFTGDILNLKLYPASIISYVRSYYKLGNIRATQDENIKVSRIFNNFQNYKNFSPLNLEVVEFKYKQNQDVFFRKNFNNFFLRAIRANKCSKYIHSIINFI